MKLKTAPTRESVKRTACKPSNVPSRRDGLLLRFVEELESDNPNGKQHALKQLWRRRWIRKALHRLIAKLQTDKDTRRLYIAIEALGELGPTANDAVPAMVALWEHPNPDLYLASRDIIADMGKAAIPRLRACLRVSANEDTQRLICTLIERCQKTGHTERAFLKYLRNMPLPSRGFKGNVFAPIGRSKLHAMRILHIRASDNIGGA